MKKTIVGLFFLLVIIFVCVNKTNVLADNIRVSDMTYNEQISFFENNNIEIPDYYKNSDEFAELLQYIVLSLENSQDVTSCFDSPILVNLVTDIKQVLLSLNESSVQSLAYEEYDGKRYLDNLNNNLVFNGSEWVNNGGIYNDVFRYYNCYAFAIDRLNCSYYELSYDNLLQIGGLSRTEWDNNYSPLQSFNVIKADLESIGYQNIEYHTICPVDIEDKELICFRYCDTDFHFMKYDKYTESWYHKVGESTIMKYIGEFDNAKKWQSEYCDQTGMYEVPVQYDSPIIYITYDSNNVKLDCYSEHNINYTSVRNNNINSDKIYELNVDCERNYSLYLNSNDNFKVKFFDYLGRELFIGNYSEDIYQLTLNKNDEIIVPENNVCNLNLKFNKQRYFMQIIPLEQDDTFNVIGNISPIELKDCYQVINNSIIINHLHNSGEESLYSYLKFENNSGKGYYKFKLDLTAENGEACEYVNPAITLYSDPSKTQVLDNYYVNSEFETISNDEVSCLFYLPSNGTYYIDINLPLENYDSVKMIITKDIVGELDLSNNLCASRFLELFSLNEKGDCFKPLQISHRSSFVLDVALSKNAPSEFKIVIYRQLYDDINKKYYLEIAYCFDILENQLIPEYSFNLDAGIYFIGYMNNFESISASYALERIVDNTIDKDNTLVADPYHEGYTLGSEVTLNNGLCDEYTITEGFTRNIYLMVEDRVLQPMSRLDYDWYSSCESVAVVTNYGTVLAKNVETDTQVTIYAILKEDPSIIYRKTFTILNDLSTEEIEITCDMSYSYSNLNGIYKLELNSSNSPFPMIQYYDWSVENQDEDLMVEINNWGYVSSNGVGNVVVIGTYTLNPRVIIYINLTITN